MILGSTPGSRPRVRRVLGPAVNHLGAGPIAEKSAGASDRLTVLRAQVRRSHCAEPDEVPPLFQNQPERLQTGFSTPDLSEIETLCNGLKQAQDTMLRLRMGTRRLRCERSLSVCIGCVVDAAILIG